MHAPVCYANAPLIAQEMLQIPARKTRRWQQMAALSFLHKNLNLPDLRISQRKKSLTASKASITTMTSTWEKGCHGAVAWIGVGSLGLAKGEPLMEHYQRHINVQFWNWGWLGLNNTQEKVVALSSGHSTGSGCGVSFMRCSVQARIASCWSRQNLIFSLRGCLLPWCTHDALGNPSQPLLSCSP